MKAALAKYGANKDADSENADYILNGIEELLPNTKGTPTEAGKNADCENAGRSLNQKNRPEPLKTFTENRITNGASPCRNNTPCPQPQKPQNQICPSS